MVLRLIAHFTAFFFVYSVQFLFSPGGIGTRVWLGVLGFLCISYEAIRIVSRKRLDPSVGRAGLLLGSMAILSIISLAANSTTDLAFVTYTPSMMVVAFAGYFTARVVRAAYPKEPGAAAQAIFVTVVLVQLIIALTMFTVPPLGQALNDIQVTSDIEADLLLETGEFRLSGFGARFFGAGIANCYALIMIASLLRTSTLSGAKVMYLSAAFLLIASFGMMMSRTTLFGSALALLLLVLPLGKQPASANPFRRQRRWFGTGLLLLPLAIVVPALVLAPNLVANIEPALRFGFELFVNYFAGGQLESRSTTHLLDMYATDLKLPVFIGDGYYADPRDPNLYYQAIDIGYFRLILYFGVPGLLLYLFFQYFTIQMSGLRFHGNEKKYFVAICMALVLSLMLKGFTDIFLYSFFLFASTAGRSGFFTVARGKRVLKPSPGPAMPIQGTNEPQLR